MIKKAKDVEIAALAEAMLQELGSLRQRGGEAYPPRLRQLAALAGGASADDQILKAAAKKTFGARAVVTEKIDKTLSLDSPVYFKEDAPAKKPTSKRAPARGSKKEGPAELAGKMVLVLEAQRRLGADAYPPTLRRLAELCDLNASDTRVTKAASHQVMTDQAVVSAKAKGGKPSLDAPVVLRSDLEGNVAVVSSLLRFALSPVTSTSKGKSTETTAFTPTEVKGRLVFDLQKPILTALDGALEREDLADDIAWVLTKGKAYFFLRENVRPSAAQPAHRSNGRAPAAPPAPERTADAPQARPKRDFAGAFREAFERLDRRNGSTNFVKLFDLRRALAEFSRDEFDAGLRALRSDGEVSLDSHEGLHGALTPEERDAGVREAGSLLIYASRG